MPGTVYTVASGKGGVGKTTTSVNLAVALWQEGNAVALIDADIGMANLAAVLNLQPEATLHDVLAGRATVEEALVEAQGGNLLVLPGDRSLESFADADPRELRAAVDDLAERCDYVIVDTGAGLSYEDVLPLGMAHGVLLVTTPDPAAFGDTRKTMEIAGLLGAPIRGLVVTRAVEDTDAAAIADEIGAELLGTIPEDPAVMGSTVAGNPLESHAPDSEAAGAYRDLGAALLDGDEEWLAAHPREPAPAPIGDTASADEPDADADAAGADDDAGDSGLETEEDWAAAAEEAIGAGESTDLGDLMAGPGDADAADESAPEADDVAESGDAPADGDGQADDDADLAEEAADASPGRGLGAAAEAPGLDDDVDEGAEAADSMDRDEAIVADDEADGAFADENDDADEEAGNAVEVGDESDDDEFEASEAEADAGEEDGEEELEGDEELEGEDELEASDESEGSDDGEEMEAESETAPDEAGESEDGPAAEEEESEDEPSAEEEEPAEPEKRGGLLGWLGRLF